MRCSAKRCTADPGSFQTRRLRRSRVCSAPFASLVLRRARETGGGSNKNLAFAGVQNLLEGQMTFAFLGLEIALRQKLAEPPISLAIGRIGQHLETIDGDEPRADEKLYGSVLGFVIGAHHAGKAVAVGDADGGEAERIGRRDHLARMRGAAQEGKIRGDGELGVGAHLHPPLQGEGRRAQRSRGGECAKLPTPDAALTLGLDPPPAGEGEVLAPRKLISLSLTQTGRARTSAPPSSRGHKVLRGTARSGGRRNPRRGSSRGLVSARDAATIRWQCVPALARR